MNGSMADKRTIIAFNDCNGEIFVLDFLNLQPGSPGSPGAQGDRGAPGNSLVGGTFPFPLEIVSELPTIGSDWYNMYGGAEYIGYLILAPSGDIYEKSGGGTFGWTLVQINNWVK